MARSSTTTGTPDLGKVWNLELSSPFDPYNNSSISTAPSSMDRIKKRSQGRGLSPNPSTPGPSSSPYLGSSAARSASYLPLSSSVPDLPSRKGSCATNRSLMSDPPDTWEDQVANDSGRDETPDSKHQSRPAVSKSRSFMDRFRSKPKQENHTPTSHLRADYAGKWNARRLSSGTRSLYESPTVREEEEEDEEFEFVAPVVKESPKEILARVASRQSSISIPASSLKPDKNIYSSSLGNLGSDLAISKAASEAVAAKLPFNTATDKEVDTGSLSGKKSGKVVKAKGSSLSLTGPMELFSISPKASLSIAGPMTIYSQEPISPVTTPSTSTPMTNNSQESASSKSNLSFMTPATVYSEKPTPPAQKEASLASSPTKTVRSVTQSQTPASPSPIMTSSRTLPQAKTLRKRASVLSTQPTQSSQNKQMILKPSSSSPHSSRHPEHPHPHPHPPISRGLTLSTSTNIILISTLTGVTAYIIENAGEVFIVLLVRKMGIAFLAGVALCLGIRVFHRRLAKIPDDLAYGFGKAVGPVVKAAVLGLKEGYVVEE